MPISVIFKKALRSALDFLLPQSPMVRFLETADIVTISVRARRAKEQLPGMISLFDYKDPLVKTFIWEMKFKNNERLAELAGRLMYEHLLAELSENALFGNAPPILMPVPLAPERLRERGFNQTERMAKAMFRLDGGKHFSVSNAVVRVRETKSQTQTKSRNERMGNLHGAFAVTVPGEIEGKHVVVLDDVATTGATLGEIRSVLLAAGAASVAGFTLAH